MVVKETGKLALVVFSILLGTFASIAFAPYVHTQHYPAWDRAEWIGPDQPAALAYFRKDLFLDSAPINASVKIAAPDDFRLYVNGKIITDSRTPWGKEESAVMVSALSSATFAIAPYLRAGKNVIAIQVIMQTIPPRPRVIADGSWQDRAGTVHRIVTDRTWRVLTKQEWQAALDIDWHDIRFRDLHWPFAASFEEPDRPIQYLDIPPGLLRDFPRGDWIWNQDRIAPRAVFRRNFDLQGEKIDHAWIGISSDAAYTLAINGHVLSVETTEWSRTTSSSMDTFNVARFLRWGENAVTLGMARTTPQGAPRLAVALVANVDGKRVDLSSDGRWLSRSGTVAGSGWTPVAVAGTMGVVPLVEEARVLSPVQLGYPSVRVLDLWAPPGWWLERAESAAAWSLAVLSANLVMVWLAVRLRGRRASREVGSTWGLCTPASAVGVIVLCFLFLLQFDVRIPQAAVFHAAVFFAVWGGTLLWIGVTLLARRKRGGSQTGTLEHNSNG